MAPHAEQDESTHGITRLPPPERPAFSASPPRLLIIGAGNRGKAYAEAVKNSSNGVIVSVIEPIALKRRHLGRKYIWGAREPVPGEEFSDWPEFVQWELSRRQAVASGTTDVPEGVDAVFICVQDGMHKDVVLGLAPLKLHIMCEKPLAPNLEDCMAIYKSLSPDPSGSSEKLFAIGHVLRYSPHNMMMRKLLLEDKVIGDIMAVNHTEPVGWYHFTHSYVRGNWRNEKAAAPSLLAKSCHDIDILYWILAAPPPGSNKPTHVPKDISSSGSLQYFRKERKPVEAGNATNCLSCAYEPSCQFSAKRIYTGADLKSQQQEHFCTVVAPEIEDCIPNGGPEAAKKTVLSKLAEDYSEDTPADEGSKRNTFGRCVYECDNDVCDNQAVTLSWNADPIAAPGETPLQALSGRGSKTATLHMVAFTEKICTRFTYIYGVHGEMYADSSSITVTDFRTCKKTVHYPHIPEGGGHGDGDEGLTRQFVLAVDRVKNHGEKVSTAQREYIKCNLRDVIMSHSMVFAAEEARKGKKVIDFPEWLYCLLDPNSHAKLNFTEFFNVIDGKLKATKETSQGVNPSALEKNPPVPVPTREDVDRAVQAAKKASEAWAEVPYKERQALVAKFADGIDSIRKILGNAFILKPSPFTPCCNLKLAELTLKYFPAGVVQTLSGNDDLGPWLTAHPGVDKISFTGSTATGKKVLKSATGNLKRVTLELGGNDPAIVCSDVNIKEVAPKLCIAIKRIFVHESIYDDVLETLASTVKSLPVGDGLESTTVMDPVQNHLQFDGVKSLLADIQSHGLKLAAGSTSPSDAAKGYFITPTVIDNPPDASRIVVEEPFGSVFPILKWKDEDEVLRRANGNPMPRFGPQAWRRQRG
ncbi:Putative aldehyde dehydrogenase [Fusarium oxysporum f. sp. cubense race 1]|uniref:aldehyde dehydrogenase (NAD(+)) n=1 Tax=Fusarium oxysporum f. sp. cubense (strain race 1) TaxID=1229664 RepID=N4UCV2_FUSC1|nr:Putative aldehyde dehydrogenase [Fusarium oxysporum f. sp. cubense race 1]